MADIDGDGDLDVILAQEFQPNVLLLNDGNGRFEDASAERMPIARHDSEDIAIADVDGDGDLDLVFVSEDDTINELYLNDGTGFFIAENDRIPAGGISNALVVEDMNGDGAPDLLVGNRGQDFLLINDGNGFFADESAARVPNLPGITQDLEIGDADGDGDLDLLVGSEGRNSLLINNGEGFFADESEARIPVRESIEETREAEFGDVDGDGDLDILFANVSLFVVGADGQNRLLINNGEGFFTDETAVRLPVDIRAAFDVELIDLDGDGDLDAVTANAFGPEGFLAFANDGSGFFQDASEELFGGVVPGPGFDVEQADFNRDGLEDLYLASRLGVDRLLLAARTAASGIRCKDVKKFKVKKCSSGRLPIQVVLRKKKYAGRRVAVTLDGETTLFAEVKKKKARLIVVDLESGPHTAELTDPAGCFPAKERVCSE